MPLGPVANFSMKITTAMAYGRKYGRNVKMRCAFLFLFVAELSAAPAWLFSADWNLLKATRRGPVPADEWFRADVRPRSFALVFR